MVVNGCRQMRNSPRFCALQWGKTDRAPSSKTQRKSPETQRFQGFFGGRGRRARSCFATPLAVPETADARFRSRRFDRCANPCSLHPPQAALAGPRLRCPKRPMLAFARAVSTAAPTPARCIRHRRRSQALPGTRFWSGCREKKNRPKPAVLRHLPPAKIVFDAVLMLLIFHCEKVKICTGVNKEQAKRFFIHRFICLFRR